MAKPIDPVTKAAADAAFRFLGKLIPVQPGAMWTLAIGKRMISVPAGSQDAYDALLAHIRSPAGCCAVTKGLQHTNHIAIETHAGNLKEYPPKTLARVQAGKMVALLWRMVNPIDVSRGTEIARHAVRVLGGHDLGVLFPLPGSVRYGTTVKLSEAIDPRRLSFPTQFVPDAAESLPDIVLNVDDPKLVARAVELTRALASFGVQGKVESAFKGPILTRFEFQPQDGVKTSRVIELSGDLARKMKAESARVSASGGSDTIGIEIRNDKAAPVMLSAILKGDAFQASEAILPLAMGVTTTGEPFIADLASMPHLLTTGATGSGKSVGLRSWVLSLTCKLPPERLGFIMLDMKKVELSVFEGIPYLVRPVIWQKPAAVAVLREAVQEMERRYEVLAAAGVRNIEAYNKRMPSSPMPYIVIIIDELAFLMTTHKKEVEASIDSLAAVARAAGMHLIVSTQRPSVDVVTGVIKANLTTRAAFAATSKVDSITMLDETGAETLFGQGDMLFREAGGRITRVHGSFVSDDDVEAIVRRMKGQRGKPYQFGAAGALPGARPQQLLSCAAEADAVKIETPKDRVRAALRGGVTLTTSELEERAAVTRQQIGRMRDSLFIEEARMSGSRSGWKLRG